MSEVEQNEAEQNGHGPVEVGSLQDRVRARDAQLAEELPIILPIPGFEDILAVRYRRLDYPVYRRIIERHGKVADPAERELLQASDILVNACETILERRGEDLYADTGMTWGVQAAQEIFGRSLPEGASQRTALRAVFRRDMSLVKHFSQYMEIADEVGQEVIDRLAGESEASSVQA